VRICGRAAKRSTAREQLTALAAICRRLGGQLVICESQDAFFEILDADEDVCMPGTVGSISEYGIHWRKKIIYAVHDTKHIGFIIHEAGHVFADRHDPDDAKCDEWEWLGWEIVVARRLDAWSAWSRQNAHYHLGDGIRGVGKGKDWRELSSKARHTIIADRLAHAKKIGLISPRGVPRSLR
jgi:hypothetical protein